MSPRPIDRAIRDCTYLQRFSSLQSREMDDQRSGITLTPKLPEDLISKHNATKTGCYCSWYLQMYWKTNRNRFLQVIPHTNIGLYDLIDGRAGYADTFLLS